MFGIVTAHLSKVSEEEKARYHAVYCGLCRALKERYGQASRAVLTYDLTFYILLANSLHEPPEERGEEHCVTHPVRKMPYARSTWTDYAADLAVALAYHKCLDDVRDEGAPRARAAAALLSGAYAKARARIPAQCAAIERSMAEIARIEAAGAAGSSPDAAAAMPDSAPSLAPAFASGPAPDSAPDSAPGLAPAFAPDAAAAAFGALLGELFAHGQGTWADPMRTLGDELGRFIYLMDAAVDYADDARTGSYNPLVLLGMPPENMKTLLSVLIGNAAATFEKLPLVQDIHLMRSVMYAGVWQKFNETYGGEGTSEGADTTEGASAAAAASTAASAAASAGMRAHEDAAEKEHHD
ncbi:MULTISPECIES: DUF5685 family protein [unclassified Adlercreutzia]|uniref:DUF5685 family protein n=1 Tax=unclassified Adlercreutzia TaxID=2636013 RepID=UPI00197CFEDA|nr:MULTISPECIES: DUF5685 family protein [unclassified Adlercreutzia]